ncbi:MAG TPA: GNAT family N-acetyltransferase [Anaerolineales bacterium]|nr:GNAT family N-acetyltransferase [Anaerolineales bacterium]
MNLRSMGYRTDLIFPGFDGSIVDRGDYLVVQTPTNPDFYWGNFLIFQDPPAAEDAVRWRQRFAEEIGSPPQTTHETFGWDSPEGELGQVETFLALGFHLVRSTVLAAGQLRPPAHVAPVEVRPLEKSAEWDQALELQILSREGGHGDAVYRTFRQRQIARYQAMIGAGWGHWYGAFLDDLLVADLGIFHRDGIGRFQSVATHPDFRRKGIAGTLVYEAADRALAETALVSLILVAEADSAPERLYRSIGFEPLEMQVGLERWDPD